MNDYERIAKIIRYLNEHASSQPGLATLAEIAGLSESHFHRLFSRWASVTPKDFLQCLTAEHAREMLLRGASVLDASLDSGLSGPGRLHDLCIKLDAASPGEIKSAGEGWKIRAGLADSSFGKCLIADGPRGICHIEFTDSIEPVQTRWHRAEIEVDDEWAEAAALKVFSRSPSKGGPLKAMVCGTDFQVKVWRALMAIPPGTLTTYGRLAEAIGKPGAARAVGTAVGKNELAYLIPCHRVIRETGVIGQYRWGKERKQAMTAFESNLSAC